jgi:hypothetical protein
MAEEMKRAAEDGVMERRERSGDAAAAAAAAPRKQKRLIDVPKVPKNMMVEKEEEDGAKRDAVIEEEGPDEDWMKRFPTLLAAREHSDLIALYFAASWCPQSVPVTELLDGTFRDVLVAPGAGEDPSSREHEEGGNRPPRLSLVYVSSDEDLDQFQSYLRPNWRSVPFDGDQRSELKRHFKTCAGREMVRLNIEERYHEIPALVVVAAAAPGDVVTAAGIQDVQRHGVRAIDRWWEDAQLKKKEQK